MNIFLMYMKHFNDYKNSLSFVEKAIKALTTLKEKYLKGESYAISLWKFNIYYYKNGEKDKALADYQKAIELDPTYKNQYINLSNFYLANKN